MKFLVKFDLGCDLKFEISDAKNLVKLEGRTFRPAWKARKISGREKISEEISETSFQISRLFSETSFSRRAVLVAHDCGYPLSRYMCRATRVAADFLDFIAFCRCSTGVALHPLKICGVALFPPHFREVSHRNLGLKRCRATRGCRSYSCGCRATLCN